MKKIEQKQKKVILTFWIVLLCAATALCAGGCGKAESSETSAAQKSATEEVITKGAISTPGAVQTEEAKAVKEEKEKAAGVTEKPGAAVPSNAEKKADTEESSALTIAGKGLASEVTFSLKEIEKIGIESYTYSFRNKENNNARQTATYSGVPLTALLEAAGWDGKSDKIRISCSDGYTGKYSIEEIDAFYAFKGENDTAGTAVPAMIAVLSEGDPLGKGKTYSAKDGAPLRLVYGQADYDCDEMKDFNTQGWGFYLCKIEIL